MDRFRIGIRLGPLLAAICMTIWLSACGMVQQELTLYRDESWHTEMTLSAPVLAAEQSLEIEFQLDRMVAQARSLGAKMSWKRSETTHENLVSYVITGRGKGFGSLGQFGVAIDPIDHQGRPALHVTVNPWESLGAMASYQLTLHAAEVLESTGIENGRGSVLWSNPFSSMEAVVIPKARGLALQLGLTELAIALAFVAAVVVMVVVRRRPAPSRALPRPNVGKVTGIGRTYCRQCGRPLSPGVGRCPHCGRAIPGRR